MASCAELAAFAEACAHEKTVYVWGTLGQPLTKELLIQMLSQYPSHFTAEKFNALYALADGSVRAFDCSGLIKRFLMGGMSRFRYDPALDKDALGFYEQAEVCGRMSSLPEVPGVCLYLPDHVGVYVGNGEVIEATANEKLGNGVIKTRLCDRIWENWFCCKEICYPASVLQHQTAREKSIYLTFDDGPADSTEPILRLLKDNGVRACFFVNHTNRPDLLPRICDEGHQLGLHSYSHVYADVYASPEAYFADLEKLEELVSRTVGLRPRLVRLPGGTNNTVHARYCKGIVPVIVRELDRRGYRIFDWNDSFLYAKGRPSLSAEEYFRRGQNIFCRHDATFFLMHDNVGIRNAPEALGALIRYCKENGIAIRTPDQYEEKHFLINRYIL